MVAVIKVASSMHRIFNYNENKIKEGVAECIGAENYPLNAEEMSIKMKLNFLLKRMELNENVQRNSLHISLNFDPSENGLTNEKLMEISKNYMEKLGFGEQPFLVYRHHDAGHPHVHLVTTNIEADGKRIDLHHLGIRKSEPARKEIEKEFDLVVAEGRNTKERYQLEPIIMGRVQYGKSESKKALNSVLRGVLDSYRYTSLPELNAVLRQYNVLADRGSENSRIYKGGGLVYRILDQNGKPIGVPIKASDFYSRPTLKVLVEKFAKNEAQRLPFKSRIKNAIDHTLLGKPMPLEDLMKLLEKQGIHVALRKNEAGLVYGITYVDHQTKCVFNGSALGKAYSAKAIQEKCLRKEVFEPNLLTHSAQKQTDAGLQPQRTAAETRGDFKERNGSSISVAGESLLETLLQAEYTADYVPNQLKRKRKKKKRKNLNTNL